MNAGKMALIVTDKAELVCQEIDKACQRGSTIIDARGGYQGDPKEVVICACSKKDMILVQQTAKRVDPLSFLIVLESNEVHGEGFRTIQIGGGNKETA